MTRSPKPNVPANYQLRVAGHLDHHWSTWFEDLTLTHNSDGTTSLTGGVADQEELHGLLTKVRDLGVTLISVATIDPGTVDHQPDNPGRYEIRLQGHLASRWTAWFEGMTLTSHSDGTAILEGPVVDQAALHGLLTKLRDLGLPLISLSPSTLDHLR
jgi:hypothetical protein